MSLFNLIFLNFTTSFLRSCFENEHSFTTLKVKRTCKKYDLKWSGESYLRASLGKSLLGKYKKLSCLFSFYQSYERKTGSFKSALSVSFSFTLRKKLSNYTRIDILSLDIWGPLFRPIDSLRWNLSINRSWLFDLPIHNGKLCVG